ncbi:MAG: hypothetical protein AVDCRST_MAG39-1766 [uncultured Sphingomonadaceae bacterium]|uniref:Uncharacterized protein n=1 Tax=uncultured Sphingomonadaceae bacterium TaxID=169976 RepID=A0A6J4SVX1_9SPHN|nr:MAG: hypothetical protein AVDCRST_MAG39-1766 [uncultured Sphingomonadaceae bacterium]
MSDRKENKAINDALQSGEGDPARGQDEQEFGAGGQDVESTGAAEQRDVDRDGKLRTAGVDASSGGSAEKTPEA